MLSEGLSSQHKVINLFTGQHDSLYDDVKHLIRVDHRLPLMKYNSLPLMYSGITQDLYRYLDVERPDMVIVQGDTASAYCGAFCAFLMGIKVGHVEAGLRTNDVLSPFPEELNREIIGRIADYNWCPSEDSVEILKRERVRGEVILTGNTIVDFIKKMCFGKTITLGNEIVVTLHRRENKDLFANMLSQLNRVALKHPLVKFIFPVHPNPNIRSQTSILTASNIHITEPMKYEDFLTLLMRCGGIITDSGGIQEEAVCLRKKTLICRNNTERKEGVKIGICNLVGDNIEDNFEWLLSPFDKAYDNPYGDGDACEKIIASLTSKAV
jgi:UDP-N-acetylglucosamine 2-epimerase (non-hydrolysing)